jgi:hypothetical protein
MARRRGHTPMHGTPLILGQRGRSEGMDPDLTPPPGAYDTDSRLAVLESKEFENRKRLAEGAATFGEIRDAFEKLTLQFSQELAKVDERNQLETEKLALKVATLASASMTTPMKALAFIVPVVIFMAGLVWAASRYPERSEFIDLQKRVNELHDISRDTAKDVKDLARAVDATSKRP